MGPKSKNDPPEELNEILPRQDGTYKVSLRVGDSPHILIEYGGMYSAPEVTQRQLDSLKELFGGASAVVSIGTISQSGCESCDWGSDYGHDIVIASPTKNLDMIGDFQNRR